jgi:hypothetical protein
MQESLLTKRLDQARQINDHFRQKLAMGEVGPLAFSQSNLQLVALQNEYETMRAEIRSNELTIKEIAGGIHVVVSDTLFPPSTLILPDSLAKAYGESPYMLHYTGELKLKEEQKNLTVSEGLPKFSAGYYSESVLDQQFKGFQLGISVPLWENANRVKRAKSDVVFAEADADRYVLLQNRVLQEKLDQLESLKIRESQLEAALGSVNEPEILALALDNGEISLSEYFYASDFYFRSQQLLLEYKRDQLLKEAELLKIYL